MNTEKTEKIFEMICEIPMDKWELAENDKRNFITNVGEVEIYIEFTQQRDKNPVVYLGKDDSCFFIVENVQLANEFRDKVLYYFKEGRAEQKLNQLYDILNNSVCNSNNR